MHVHVYELVEYISECACVTVDLSLIFEFGDDSCSCNSMAMAVSYSKDDETRLMFDVPKDDGCPAQ